MNVKLDIVPFGNVGEVFAIDLSVSYIVGIDISYKEKVLNGEVGRSVIIVKNCLTVLGEFVRSSDNAVLSSV